MDGGIPCESLSVPRPDAATLREVKAITVETVNKYKVAWEGLDPDTGKLWKPSWVSKSDCTDQVIAQWEAKKWKVKSENTGSGNTGSTGGSKNEQQAGLVEKRKRQCEDTSEEEWLQDMKAKKRLSPSIKIGPPRGAKRNEPIASDTSSSACIQKSSQTIPKAPSLALSSSTKSSSMGPILPRQEGESFEDDLHRSQDAPPISTASVPDGYEGGNDTSSSGGSHMPLHALKNQEIPLTSTSTAMETMDRASIDVGVSHMSSLPTLAKAPSSSVSLLLQKTNEIKELQFEISVASNATLKLALENAPLFGPLTNMEEIQRLQCEISIASNTALKVVLEAMEILGRDSE